MIKFSVYADGSSNGRSNGAIGWGYVVLRGDQVLCGGSGGAPIGTNNIAELMGAREGLRSLLYHPEFLAIPSGTRFIVELVCDSQYVLGLANGSYSASKNVALAEHLRSICASMGVTTRWVRGHDGDLANELCDKLAKSGKAAYQEPKPSTRGAARKARRAVDKKIQDP